MNTIKSNRQMNEWSGHFGWQYTDRNLMTLEEMEKLWEGNYGFTRSEINKLFLSRMDASSKILEVGSNIGNQLACLQKGGFKKLYGIDLQFYAVDLIRKRTKGIQVVQGSAFELPFKDRRFDIVFTSGLLIHIAPDNINAVLDEVYRCSARFIWGAEYYGATYIEVPYRGKEGLMWKGDFSRMFLDRFKDLRSVKEVSMKYLQNENVDVMYLLEKDDEREEK